MFFNSKNLASLSSDSMQVLTILRLSEYGIDSFTSMGWQLLWRRYWLRSVGFLYRSVMIFPSLIWHCVSKYGIDLIGAHSQDGSSYSDSLCGVVCVIVNFIVGWMEFNSSKNLCSFCIDPKNIRNMSSKKRFMHFIGMIPFSMYFAAISHTF